MQSGLIIQYYFAARSNNITSSCAFHTSHQRFYICRMEPIINKHPSYTTTTFRRMFDVDDLPADGEYGNEHTDTITFNDHEYSVLLRLTGEAFCVYLCPLNWTESFTVEYSLRALSDTEPITLGPMQCTFDDSFGFGGSLVRKCDLLEHYSKDGKFVVDTVFSSTSPQSSFDFLPPMGELKYTDFIIKHDGLELPCHKFVVVRESKVGLYHPFFLFISFID